MVRGINLEEFKSLTQTGDRNRELIDRQIREGEELVAKMKAAAGPSLLDQVRKKDGDAPISPG